MCMYIYIYRAMDTHVATIAVCMYIYIYDTVDSKKLEYGPGTINAGFPSSVGFGLEDSHIPTFWLLLYPQRPFIKRLPGSNALNDTILGT